MNYTVNNQLRTSILFDGTAEARLADILAIMDTHTFGKREAAKNSWRHRKAYQTDRRKQNTFRQAYMRTKREMVLQCQ